MSASQSRSGDTCPTLPVRLVGEANEARSKVLFLGYTEKQTGLIEKLILAGCQVWHSEEKIASTAGFDLVISYGYRKIITRSTITSSSAPIVNLHISYLPWNRGSHPNFWSFYDRTPSGVSIHLIDEGIDTGSILYQKPVEFGANEKTFSSTYKRLVAELEGLFIENVEAIVTKTFAVFTQIGRGSFHRLSDLPIEFSGWESDVDTEIARLRTILTGQKSASDHKK